MLELDEKCVEMFGILIMFVIKYIYVGVSVGLIDYGICGEVIKMIEIEFFIFVFVVFSVLGEIVVFDEEERHVYVFFL